MKRSELEVGMTVENSRGSKVVVVSTSSWRDRKGAWASHATGASVESFPVRSMGYVTPGATGVLCVSRGQIAAAREAAPGKIHTLQGKVYQPNRLFPVGTLEAKRDAEDARFIKEYTADLAADLALVARVRDLWGSLADVLLEDAQVDVDDDALLTTRERDVVRVIIACGERR